MKATTIKLEGELLENLEAAKPPDRSLSGHVRSVLQKDLERQRARDAAVACRAFLDAPLRIRTDDVRGQAAFAVLLACMAYGAEMSRG